MKNMLGGIFVVRLQVQLHEELSRGICFACASVLLLQLQLHELFLCEVFT